MQKITPTKHLTIKYTMLQGTYWMAYCAIYSFAMDFLLAKGLQAAPIGLILALGSIATSLIQPTLAATSERSGKPTLKAIVLTGVLAAMVLSALVMFLNGIALAVAFCALTAVIQTLLPFINALAFEHINAGDKLNYGIARAGGSIFFAGISTTIGIFIAQLGGMAMPMMYLALLALTMLAILVVGGPKSASAVHSANAAAPTPLIGYLTRYRKFCVLLVGLTLSFIQHSVINSYLTQIMESVGGSSVDKGVALAVAAIAELPTMAGFALLTRKFKISSLIRFAGVFMTVKALWFVLATSVTSLYFAHAIQMLGYAIYIPASVYYVNKIMAERDRVKGVALINVPMTLGSVFGTLAGGWIISMFGLHSLLVASTIISALGCIIIFFSVEETSA